MLYVMWCRQIFWLGKIYRLCGVTFHRSGRCPTRWSLSIPLLFDYFLYSGGWATIPWPRPLFFHVTRLNFHIKSRNLGLPSERVASINMHSSAYLSPQLFRIVQRFSRTTRWCVDWVRSPFYPVPRQNFGSTSPLFSKYTSRQNAERMCIWRTTGRRCRNPVSERGRAWTTYPIYTSSGCPWKALDNPKELRW